MQEGQTKSKLLFFMLSYVTNHYNDQCLEIPWNYLKNIWRSNLEKVTKRVLKKFWGWKKEFVKKFEPDPTWKSWIGFELLWAMATLSMATSDRRMFLKSNVLSLIKVYLSNVHQWPQTYESRQGAWSEIVYPLNVGQKEADKCRAQNAYV